MFSKILEALGHLRVLVRFARITTLNSRLAHNVFDVIRLVDVESEVALELNDLGLSGLHLLEVSLRLVLQGSVRLHKVIIELY